MIFGSSAERKNYPPSQHGRGSRRKQSDAVRSAKTKLRTMDFSSGNSRDFRERLKKRGVTGETLLQLLRLHR
jgi:hypothetical protein